MGMAVWCLCLNRCLKGRFLGEMRMRRLVIVLALVCLSGTSMAMNGKKERAIIGISEKRFIQFDNGTVLNEESGTYLPALAPGEKLKWSRIIRDYTDAHLSFSELQKRPVRDGGEVIMNASLKTKFLNESTLEILLGHESHRRCTIPDDAYYLHIEGFSHEEASIFKQIIESSLPLTIAFSPLEGKTTQRASVGGGYCVGENNFTSVVSAELIRVYVYSPKPSAMIEYIPLKKFVQNIFELENGNRSWFETAVKINSRRVEFWESRDDSVRSLADADRACEEKLPFNPLNWFNSEDPCEIRESLKKEIGSYDGPLNKLQSQFGEIYQLAFTNTN